MSILYGLFFALSRNGFPFVRCKNISVVDDVSNFFAKKYQSVKILYTIVSNFLTNGAVKLLFKCFF